MSKLTDKQLEDLKKYIRKCIKLQIENEALRLALNKYVKAQSRMLDKWADGDSKVKNKLWKNLHSLEGAARQLLNPSTTPQ